MPEPTAAELANELRQATLDYLWRQWRVVGAGVTSSSPARTIIDPEALVLMSLTMLEHERRLADVVWSWIDVNHALVSVQRLGNLRWCRLRCATVHALANRNVAAEDFVRPGHMFPLVAKSGGVLMRSGHTEAAIDLVKLAGLAPGLYVVRGNGAAVRLMVK